METVTPKKKRPLWKWIQLLIAGITLSILGYASLVAGFELSDRLGYTVLTIVFSAILLGMYAIFVRLLEGHWPTDLKLRGLIPHTLLGQLIGFIYMVLVVGTIIAANCATMSWNDFSGKEQFNMFMLFLAVAVGEELICRGVIFRLIDERWNTWVALVVSALLFGFSHISNDNATWWSSLAISIEAGLLLGAAYKWSGTLWVPIGIHWTWNYVQGNVFGFAVSGQNAGNTIFTTTTQGPDIITGGAFGPEASIIAVVFGALITIVFMANRYRHFSQYNKNN